MAAVDGTIVLLALLPIASELRSDFVVIVWVVIAYLLVNTAFVLSLGRIGDMFGRKRMYNLGFAIFTVGSVLCGIATSDLMLIVFRALQGVGAACLTANSFAILSEAFPPQERGRAFGINAIVWGIGSVLGIVVGGVLIHYTSWRWIFLINLPIGAFGTFWAWRALHEIKPTGPRETFDLAGGALFTLGLLSLLFGITYGLVQSWTSLVTVATIAFAPVAFALFAFWELRMSKDPIVDFSLFREIGFAYPVASSAVQSLATFSVNFLLVFYLEGIAGLDVLTASYLIVPMALATAIMGPIAGRISDRVGSRAVATTGLALQLVALVLLSRLSTTTSILEIGGIEAVYGFGGGMFWPSNTSAIMSAAPPRRYGVASGIMNTFRNSGMVLSFALGLLAATQAIPPRVVGQLFVGTLSGKLSPALAGAYLTGESFAYEISAALLIVAILLSLMRGSRAGARPEPAAAAHGTGGS
jgi:EmrB/QacA subfamily drug resistance transporter